MKRAVLLLLVCVCAAAVSLSAQTKARPKAAAPAPKAAAPAPAPAPKREQAVPFKPGEVLEFDIGWSTFNFTQKTLPYGIHASSRGIASVASAAPGSATAGEPSARRSTVVMSAGSLPIKDIPEEVQHRNTTPARSAFDRAQSHADRNSRFKLISAALIVAVIISIAILELWR